MSTGMTKLLSQFYVPIQVQIQVQIYVQIHVQVHVQIHVQFFMSNLMSSFSCPSQPKKVSLSASWISKLDFCTY